MISATADITNSKFHYHYSHGNGGAIYNWGGILTVADSEGLSNVGYNGGVIYSFNGTLNVYRFFAQNNTAHFHGGFFFGSQNVYESFTLITAKHNYAKNSGGVFYFEEERFLRVLQSNMTQNTAGLL